jgi:hypothetical protein
LPDALPAPTRLAASADFANTSAASLHRSPAALTLTIQVQGLPTPLRNGACGVAIEPVHGHGVRQWLPFPPADGPDATLELRTVVGHQGDYACTVASCPAAASRGYFARAVATIGRDGATITIDARATLLTFAPAKDVQHAGPFRLTRSNDPRWTAPGSAAAGISIRDGAASSIWLGHGAYELGDPLRPERRLQFSTTDVTSIAISDDLATPRAARP